MTDLRERLRDADPLLHEPHLPADDAAAMRRRVVETARHTDSVGIAWKRTLAIAAGVAVVAGAGIDTARRVPRAQDPPAPVAATRAGASAARTQVQFSTPGGTRIIWTIDPAFHLTESR